MLIPILVSVFVAIAFKNLSEKHKKNKAQYATFGVLWFLIGSFGVAFLIGLFSNLLGIDVFQINQFILSILLYVIGGVMTYIYFNYPKRKWATEKNILDNELLDDVLIED